VQIRALGSPYSCGEAFPYGFAIHLTNTSNSGKSCSQGGGRGGAATGVLPPIWQLEVESLLVCLKKQPAGVERTVCGHLDYGVQFNRLM